jgi:ferredoxin
MTYVVTDACIGCKYTDCVVVCPVDCFHEGDNFLVIDPDTCIDCGICEAECPVEAIVAEADLSMADLHWAALNEELAGKWPRITERRQGLETADEMAGQTGKLAYLIR